MSIFIFFRFQLVFVGLFMRSFFAESKEKTFMLAEAVVATSNDFLANIFLLLLLSNFPGFSYNHDKTNKCKQNKTKTK